MVNGAEGFGVHNGYTAAADQGQKKQRNENKTRPRKYTQQANTGSDYQAYVQEQRLSPASAEMSGQYLDAVTCHVKGNDKQATQ